MTDRYFEQIFRQYILPERVHSRYQGGGEPPWPVVEGGLSSHYLLNLPGNSVLDRMNVTQRFLYIHILL